MSEGTFKHHELKLVEPQFSSSLTDLIIELDYLRKRNLGGTTHPKVFFQIKHIFHTLESIGSARIAGNNTTIADYIETKLGDSDHVSNGIREIQNIEKALAFVEHHISEYPINRFFVSEIHKIIVAGLPYPPDGEGDKTPGEYRKINPRINKSDHLPPDWITVDQYMNELFDFIAKEDSSKYDLLKAAIAHHRFVWIHPFGNGNGRAVRLLTYAMLLKTGFKLDFGRIINPTAVFCNDRNEYYNFLSMADTGTEEGILSWAEYVLNGFKLEIEKIDKLLDYNYLKSDILLPTINYALEVQVINELEAKILRRVIEKQIIQASDVKELIPGKADAIVSRLIKKLIDKRMLDPVKEGSRKYVIQFNYSYLMRGFIRALGNKGFLPIWDPK